ncbi:MAG: response regulator [Candidatus Omnitrophica bacterium]|nr:response regulator [Candidatus Omnitrophota bacterium]
MKIIVADDRKDAAGALEALLSKRGHDVDVVYDGQLALKKIKKNDYDLAFLDQDMPGLTGLEVVKYVKEHEMAIKTVILTGYPEIEDFFVKALGADEYVRKGNPLEDIKRILDKYSKE